MDKFGRKKIILVKACLTLLFLCPLIVIGFIGNILKEAVFTTYFFSILAATFSFDVIIHGFEKI